MKYDLLQSGRNAKHGQQAAHVHLGVYHKFVPRHMLGRCSCADSTNYHFPPSVRATMGLRPSTERLLAKQMSKLTVHPNVNHSGLVHAQT